MDYPWQPEDEPGFYEQFVTKRPADKFDDTPSEIINKMALDYYQMKFMVDGESVKSIDLPRHEYKEGLLAKRTLFPSMNIDKSYIFGTHSVDEKIVVSVAADIKTSCKGVYLTVSWDVITFLDSVPKDSISKVKILPSIEVLHPIDVGRLNANQAARLGDLLAMLKGSVKPSFVELIIDNEELFISLISLDPRIVVLLSMDPDKRAKNPIRFKIADVLDYELLQTSFKTHIMSTLSAIDIIVTRAVCNDLVTHEYLLPSYLECINPLFEHTEDYTVSDKLTINETTSLT